MKTRNEKAEDHRNLNAEIWAQVYSDSQGLVFPTGPPCLPIGVYSATYHNSLAYLLNDSVNGAHNKIAFLTASKKVKHRSPLPNRIVTAESLFLAPVPWEDALVKVFMTLINFSMV